MQYVGGQYLKQSELYQIPIYAIPIDGIFSYPLSLLTYNKAGFVYNMLRKQIGDSTFFPAFRNILKKFSYKSAETNDIAEAWKEQVQGFDFDTFFDQWIYSAGHPIFNLNAYCNNWGNNRYKITLAISQTQTGMNIPDVFKTPIRVLFFKDSTEQTFKDFYLSKRDDTLETFITFRPDSIAIDETYLLCQVNETKLGVDLKQNVNNEISISPNPVLTGSNAFIHINSNEFANSEISIYDELGRKIRQINQEFLNYSNSRIELNTSDLQKGIYFIKIISRDNSETKILKMLVM
jgi:hypothetical protein